MRKIPLKWIVLFLAPVVFMFSFQYIIPLFIVVITSFTDYRMTRSGISFAGLNNYIRLFTADKTFFIALKNTLAWMFLHVFFHVAIGVFLALILSKKPRGWKFVRTVYMAPNIIASSAVGLIFMQIFHVEYGLVNKFLEYIGLDALTRNWLFDTRTAFFSLTMVWFLFAGYTCTLVLARILSLPGEMFEAATIEGASSLQIDFYITLPLVKDTVATTMVMAAAYMLTMFPLIYVTTNGGPGVLTTNLPLYLYKTAMLESNFGYANTIGVVIIFIGILSMQIINRVMKTNQEQ
ncbi:ABC transporter permease [Spirochaetia bacterium]|nr:ABC transporter permease [Spirochaetia bacterium]